MRTGGKHFEETRMGKTYLIINGTGLLGRALFSLLSNQKEQASVILTCRNEEQKPEGDHFRIADIRNSDELNAVIAECRPDVIYDFATQDSVSYTWSYPKETIDVNINGTINLLEAVRSYSDDTDNHPRIIFCGSGEEYGRTGFSKLPLSEESYGRPNNIYGATKECQRMLAKLYAKAYGMDIVIMRIFNEISNDQSDLFSISNFAHQFARMEKGIQEPVLEAGNISNIRCFTDSRDIARAMVLVAEKGKSGEVYNVANSAPHSLSDVISILEDLTGIKAELKADAKRIRPIDAPAITADITKIKHDIGWEPEIPLEQTVTELLQYWKDFESRQ